jgi:hypothetical protein
MTRKDPSHVDLEIDEPATDRAVSRRGLVARAGAAGLAGLAAALVGDRIASASAPDSEERPNIPTPADTAKLQQVMALELAAGDLYGAALEGADEDLAPAVTVMASNHRAYAQAIAGEAGLSANSPDTQLFDENVDAFTGSTDEFLEAAHALEQSFVTTHTELIGEYESIDAISLTASISVVEARQATVLADLLGVDDDDILFGNEQPALQLSGDEA